MDQSTLVIEQIEIGQRLVTEFNDFAPLRAAFWRKDDETGEWQLYLASDRFNNADSRIGYREASRILGPSLDYTLNPVRVKIRGTNDLLVQSVVAFLQKYPSLVPGRIHDRLPGWTNVEDVYVYALPAPVSA
jgi:hypothetical protein